MSRIGRMPVPIPSGAQVALEPLKVQVKGPRGSLEVALPEGIRAEMDGSEVRIQRRDDSKAQRSLHGVEGAAPYIRKEVMLATAAGSAVRWCAASCPTTNAPCRRSRTR